MSLNIKELRKRHNLSQQELADRTGIPKGRINNWEQNKGTPKTEDYNTLTQFFNSVEIKESQKIPFYDAIAVGGLSVYQADQSPVARTTETVEPGTWFRSASAAMRVYGDSMFPKYRSGCIIALKEIFDKEEIVFGEDYVIETAEQRVLKRLMRSEKGEEFIEMNSINPQTDGRGKLIYASKDFHLGRIKRIYKVLGQIQYEAGGDSIVHRTK